MLEKTKNLAVLIDADNTSHNLIDVILEEIAKYGTACVKYIYGDWSTPALKSWKDKCLSYGLIAVQQFTYTTQKNSTDIAMVIDAMDLLHSKTFDGFCLVSSDSDFTGLASRIRRDGLVVYGLGRENTPEAFRKSCDKFIYTNNLSVDIDVVNDNVSMKTDLDVLSSATLQEIDKVKVEEKLKQTPAQILKQDTKLMNLIRSAIKAHEDDLGWASLSVVGSYISKIQPEFDYRTYGFSKLSSLVKAIDLFRYKTIGSQLVIANIKPGKPKACNKLTPDIQMRIQQSIEINQSPQYNGWAYLGDISKTLKGMNILYTSFGYSTLSSLLEHLYESQIETKVVDSQKFVRFME